MENHQKNLNNIDIEKLKYLIDSLHKSGLKNLSITGGEPCLHPEIIQILKFINKYKFNNLFFHTNGIFLSHNIMDLLFLNFNKIAVSIHSVNFSTWKTMTGGDLNQFNKILENLNYLSLLRKKSGGRVVIELKMVPLKEVNDSEDEIKMFLDFCNAKGFKFKILNFEPVNENHFKFSIEYKKIISLFQKVGCQEGDIDKLFRGQGDYLPYKNYYYGNTYGVIIKIGCGDKRTCKQCYLSNEIFVTPLLQLKPCHVSNKTIDLNKSITTKDPNKIKDALLQSRVFLKKSPGAGAKTWNDSL